MYRKLWILGFDIVSGCQLRCTGCPNSTLKRPITKIKLHDFEACLANIDVKLVNSFRLFNFGEPLLHDDIPGIIGAIKRQRFHTRRIEITTNAQHHDFTQLEEIMKTRHVHSIHISCDGDGTAAQYEEQRPPAKWDKLLEFFAKASEFRKRHSPGTVLATRTICDTPEGKQRWHELLDPLGITPEFRNRWNMPDAADFDTVRARKIPNRPCIYMGTHRLYVNADGTVGTCCQHPQVLTLGNLKTQTYSEIFQGRPRQFLKNLQATNRALHPICGKCEAESHYPSILKKLHKIIGANKL